MAQPEHINYDVIIIGAGLSGLSAGIRLSQFFKRVLILESHTVPGGLNSYYEHGRPEKHLFSAGLHTVTNARVTGRRWGLGLIARNLGIKPEEFAIHEPTAPSRITSGDVSLRFSNDTGLLRSEIERVFPGSIDEFLRFETEIMAQSGILKAAGVSARMFLEDKLSSRELADALALPVFTYAGYSLKDLDLRTFSLLYRSIFMDGCGSPIDMKAFLGVLTRKFANNGGEVCYECKVDRIEHDNGKMSGVLTSGGNRVKANFVLSSAGLYETGQLAGISIGKPGEISVFQLTSCYPGKLTDMGIQDTLHFWNRRNSLEWEFKSEDEILGIITFSAQDSYNFDTTKHQLKISCFDRLENWQFENKNEYRQNKRDRVEKLISLAGNVYQGLVNAKPLYVDSFTPETIRRYTSHPNGTLYGGAEKAFDGRTPIGHLFVIGNDQGGMGIMGALTSGVIVSNYRVLTNS